MGIKVERNTFKMRESRGVILPRNWCVYYGKRIDKVTMIASGLLIIAPQGMEEQARKLVEQMEESEEGCH